jgi:hypothetical protein
VLIFVQKLYDLYQGMGNLFLGFKVQKIVVYTDIIYTYYVVRMESVRLLMALAAQES